MNMSKQICMNCNDGFIIATKRLRFGEGKFCSIKCSSSFYGKLKKLSKNPNCVCSYCGTKFHKIASKMSKSKSGLFFCCREHKDLSSRLSSNIPIKPEHYGIALKTYKCTYCTKNYERSYSRKPKNAFCSRECSKKHRETLKKAYCESCGHDLTLKSYNRGKLCTYCRIKMHRHLVKIRAIVKMGGQCVDCGYKGDPCAFDFHHLHGKDFNLSNTNRYKAWDKIERELSKCILLCSICHRKRHTDSSFAKGLLLKYRKKSFPAGVLEYLLEER